MPNANWPWCQIRVCSFFSVTYSYFFMAQVQSWCRGGSIVRVISSSDNNFKIIEGDQIKSEQALLKVNQLFTAQFDFVGLSYS